MAKRAGSVGCSPRRRGHWHSIPHAPLYIPLVGLHTKQTGAHKSDFTARGQQGANLYEVAVERVFDDQVRPAGEQKLHRVGPNRGPKFRPLIGILSQNTGLSRVIRANPVRLTCRRSSPAGASAGSSSPRRPPGSRGRKPAGRATALRAASLGVSRRGLRRRQACILSVSDGLFMM